MNAFQIISIALLCMTILLSLARFRRGKLSAVEVVFWGGLQLLAAVTVLYPALAVRTAHILGIGRGSDLVMYCGILGMLTGFFAVYCRLRRFEERFATIVRQMALQERRIEELSGELSAELSQTVWRPR